MAGPKMSLSRRLAIGRSLNRALASGDGRHDGDFVIIGHLRLESRPKPDVFIIEVHVHELAELAVVVEQAVLEAGVALVEGVDRRPDIRSFYCHGHLAFGEAPERAGDAKLGHTLNTHP